MSKEKVTIWMDQNNGQGIIASRIAEKQGYEVEIKNISTKYSWKELREVVPDAQTVPQIFVGTKHVGGFKGFMDELHLNPADYQSAP